MRLRYWHKLGLLAGAMGIAGVVVTASYAQIVHRQQVSSTGEGVNRSLGLALSRVVEAGILRRARGPGEPPGPARPPQLSVSEESIRDVTAVANASKLSEAAIRQVQVISLTQPGKQLRRVWQLHKANPDDAATAPGEAVAVTASLAQALEAAALKRGPSGTDGVLLARASQRSDTDNDLMAYPITERETLLGWILIDISTVGETGSERFSLLTFAGTLCGVMVIAGLIASWMATQRLREASDALARVAKGETDVALEDDTDDEVGDISRAATRTAETLRDTLELKRSMRLAEQVQRALLPACPPSIPGLSIAHFCDYCDDVGGDYVDYLRVGEGCDISERGWAVMVGDGTGHGVGAALLMATARAVLRTHDLKLDNLAEAINKVNAQLCDQVPDGKFLTLFLLAFSEDAKRLRWLSAGHDEAILFDAISMDFAELKGSDIPLGVEKAWEFTDQRRDAPLSRGSVLVIGTDGIWEMRNAAGAMFGKDQLKRQMRRSFQEPAAVIGEHILSALRQHRGDMPPQDDVTFIVIKVDG